MDTHEIHHVSGEWTRRVALHEEHGVVFHLEEDAKQAVARVICAGNIGITPGRKQMVHGLKRYQTDYGSKPIFPFWSV